MSPLYSFRTFFKEWKILFIEISFVSIHAHAGMSSIFNDTASVESPSENGRDTAAIATCLTMTLSRWNPRAVVIERSNVSPGTG